MPDAARARIEGYAAGVRATLDTLEHAGCLSTVRARRFVDRLRRQMTAGDSSDMVQPPCPHREALEDMHRYLYPELHEVRTEVYQWHAGTIEDVAGILNRALGCEFWEGLVAKRNDSIYPRQRRSAELDFPFWMKHRWAF